MSVPDGMWASQVTDTGRQREKNSAAPSKIGCVHRRAHTAQGLLTVTWHTEGLDIFVGGIYDLMTHDHV